MTHPLSAIVHPRTDALLLQPAPVVSTSGGAGHLLALGSEDRNARERQAFLHGMVHALQQVGHGDKALIVPPAAGAPQQQRGAVPALAVLAHDGVLNQSVLHTTAPSALNTHLGGGLVVMPAQAVGGAVPLNTSQPAAGYTRTRHGTTVSDAFTPDGITALPNGTLMGVNHLPRAL